MQHTSHSYFENLHIANTRFEYAMEDFTLQFISRKFVKGTPDFHARLFIQPLET